MGDLEGISGLPSPASILQASSPMPHALCPLLPAPCLGRPQIHRIDVNDSGTRDFDKRKTFSRKNIGCRHGRLDAPFET